MKVYEGANIRNVAVIGHGHAGKTSLVSAMLYTAGAAPRLGRVDDGSATTDYDEEEIARKMSISAGLAYVEWGKTKINIVDTPGFNMFVHEAKMVLPVVDAAIVVVDGVAGVEVVTQRVWNYCEEYQDAAPDRRQPHGSRARRRRTRAGIADQRLRPRGHSAASCPSAKRRISAAWSTWSSMKAYTYEMGGNGKGKEAEIPADMKDAGPGSARKAGRTGRRRQRRA